MPNRNCPAHTAILTPTDTTCHSHESDTQQRFHNLHCQALSCPHALHGKSRYDDMPILAPRSSLERFLKMIG